MVVPFNSQAGGESGRGQCHEEDHAVDESADQADRVPPFPPGVRSLNLQDRLLIHLLGCSSALKRAGNGDIGVATKEAMQSMIQHTKQTAFPASPGNQESELARPVADPFLGVQLSAEAGGERGHGQRHEGGHEVDESADQADRGAVGLGVPRADGGVHGGPHAAHAGGVRGGGIGIH